MSEFQRPEERIVVVRFDLENFEHQWRRDGVLPLEKFDISAGFDRLLEWLNSIGRVVSAFAFGPWHLIQSYHEVFFNYGFIPSVCPKTKKGIVNDVLIRHGFNFRHYPQIPLKERDGFVDTSDPAIIGLGMREMGIYNPDSTYFCIGSGDCDFMPLIQKLKKRGIKIAVVVASINSAHEDILNSADSHPETGKPMIFLFSKTGD